MPCVTEYTQNCANISLKSFEVDIWSRWISSLSGTGQFSHFLHSPTSFEPLSLGIKTKGLFNDVAPYISMQAVALETCWMTQNQVLPTYGESEEVGQEISFHNVLCIGGSLPIVTRWWLDEIALNLVAAHQRIMSKYELLALTTTYELVYSDTLEEPSGSTSSLQSSHTELVCAPEKSDPVVLDFHPWTFTKWLKSTPSTFTAVKYTFTKLLGTHRKSQESEMCCFSLWIQQKTSQGQLKIQKMRKKNQYSTSMKSMERLCGSPSACHQELEIPIK